MSQVETAVDSSVVSVYPDHGSAAAALPQVVADRNLVTGQNPASSGGVAQVALARPSAALRG